MTHEEQNSKQSFGAGVPKQSLGTRKFVILRSSSNLLSEAL
jgi:hypothetical protein